MVPILPQTGTIPPQVIKGASGARFAEGLKHRRHGARLEASAHVIETLGDIDMLRAVARAFAALDAIAHQLGFACAHRARRIVLRQPRKPAVRVARVVSGKAAGNVNTLGTWHAVAASRAGHTVRFLKLHQHARNRVELVGRHRIRQREVCQ